MRVLKTGDSDWYHQLVYQVQSYFTSEKITKTNLFARYKMATNEDEDDYRYRCKSLAAIYNYFIVSNDSIEIRKGKYRDLYIFVTDGIRYSTEHFIISDASTKEVVINVENGEYNYRIENNLYNRYVNNLFNFIFIPEEVNNSLKNYWLPYKKKVLESSIIECSFSSMVLTKLNKLSEKMNNAISSANTYDEDMTHFLSEDFENYYIDYAKQVLDAVIERLKQTE